MKVIFPISLLVLSLYIYSCANQGSPTGGPKDTIPPLLFESSPAHRSTNYTKQTFSFVFDERINTDKLKQNLVITPFTENKYTFKTKKNLLFIEFEHPFDTNTTYTFNFASGVTDVTEKNPVDNFIHAFSTGPIIDSLFIEGYVTDLYKSDSLDKVLVTIYHITDTLNILTGKPRYFAKTDKEGHFKIDNIKNGNYRLYAYKDENNNLICDPDKEAHGFLADTLKLNQSKSSLHLKVQLINSNPLKFIRPKNTGQYFDAAYSKAISNYNLALISSKTKLRIPYNNLIEEDKTIRFYYDSAYRYEKDSIGLIVNTGDSLNNSSLDSIYVKFKESKRKPQAFEYSLKPKEKEKIEPTVTHTFIFNKPIVKINTSGILYKYDTLYQMSIPDSVYQWNSTKTRLTLKSTLDTTFFKSKVDSLLTIYSDTTNQDSLRIRSRQYLEKLNTQQIQLYIPLASFISIENDTVSLITRIYQFKQPGDFGIISGNITTNIKSYTLQLTNTKYTQVFREIKNPKNYRILNVPPGKYSFRVLIDNNDDGRWDYGNILQNREPEEIIFYPQQIDIRANWEIENINIDF